MGPRVSEPPVWDPAQGTVIQTRPSSVLSPTWHPQLQMRQDTQGWGTLRESTESAGGLPSPQRENPRLSSPCLWVSISQGCPQVAGAIPPVPGAAWKQDGSRLRGPSKNSGESRKAGNTARQEAPGDSQHIRPGGWERVN